MKLELVRVAGTWPDPTPPSLYRTDRGTFVIQGNLVPSDVDGAGRVGDEQVLVEVPLDVLPEVARLLG